MLKHKLTMNSPCFSSLQGETQVPTKQTHIEIAPSTSEPVHQPLELPAVSNPTQVALSIESQSHLLSSSMAVLRFFVQQWLTLRVNGNISVAIHSKKLKNLITTLGRKVSSELLPSGCVTKLHQFSQDK